MKYLLTLTFISMLFFSDILVQKYQFISIRGTIAKCKNGYVYKVEDQVKGKNKLCFPNGRARAFLINKKTKKRYILRKEGIVSKNLRLSRARGGTKPGKLNLITDMSNFLNSSCISGLGTVNASST